jgi:uncharacterized protein (DUF1330 family)
VDPASPCYVLVNIEEVLDPDAFAAFAQAPGANPRDFGGEVLAIGRPPQVYDGASGLTPMSMILQRWPSYAEFDAWQRSDVYKPVLALRNKAVRCSLVVLPSMTTPPAMSLASITGADDAVAASDLS